MQRSDAENARRASRGQSRKVQSDASQTRRNTSPDMSAPQLLIVEDELAIQELIVFVCEAEGFRTTRAGSIAEARSALAAERPDLILLDRMLPDRPGEEWLRELRSDAKTADVPVIILTARGNESDRVAGLDAGADDYVVKPFFAARADCSSACGASPPWCGGHCRPLESDALGGDGQHGRRRACDCLRTVKTQRSAF